MNRLKHVLDLVDKILNEFKPTVSVIRHEVDSHAGTEYIYIRILFPKINAVVTLREYWRLRKLVAYGYYMRVKAYEEWWDNRPHHPEIPTFPHHKHVKDKIYPLNKPSLRIFLERTKRLLTAEGGGKTVE